MSDTQSIPSSVEDSTSLAHEINTAIASSHTKINRLILDRMPKAVPPQTDNPSSYITGLLYIGAIYVAFESLWQNLIDVHSEIAPIPYSFPFTPEHNHHDDADQTPPITDRLRRVLEDAYSPNLLRAARIKSDVQAMTNWPDHVFDAQLKLAGTSGRLGRFTLHIRDAVTVRPHLLLAYAYCLYLALLSGGSYIRTELLYLRPDFWSALPTPVKPGMVACRRDKVKTRRRYSSVIGDESGRRAKQHLDDDDDDDEAASSIDLPLEFLDFDPPLGENPRQQTKALKAEFKQRFAEAEQLLADPERHDIVRESTAIFHHLEGVVAQLDKIFATDDDVDGLEAGFPSSFPLKTHALRALNPPLGSSARVGGVGVRLRDSIAIAKGRLLRTRRKSSGTPTMPTIVDKWSSVNSESGSSKPSSVSEHKLGLRELEDDGAEPNGDGHHKGGAGEGETQEHSPESILAHDAAVPADGFRTIRYDSELPKPDRSATMLTDDKNTNEKTAAVNTSGTPHNFDGANSEMEYCPMTTRTPATATAAVQTKSEPDYALYVIISNCVMLVGVVGVFVAWLFVRHGDGQRVRVVEL